MGGSVARICLSSAFSLEIIAASGQVGRLRRYHIRSACSARQSPNKRSEVGAVVGSGYNEIRNRKIGKLGQHIVESHECASCGCTVVIPNLAIARITPNLEKIILVS